MWYQLHSYFWVVPHISWIAQSQGQLILILTLPEKNAERCKPLKLQVNDVPIKETTQPFNNSMQCPFMSDDIYEEKYAQSV